MVSSFRSFCSRLLLVTFLGAFAHSPALAKTESKDNGKKASSAQAKAPSAKVGAKKDKAEDKASDKVKDKTSAKEDKAQSKDKSAKGKKARAEDKKLADKDSDAAQSKAKKPGKEKSLAKAEDADKDAKTRLSRSEERAERKGKDLAKGKDEKAAGKKAKSELARQDKEEAAESRSKLAQKSKKATKFDSEQSDGADKKLSKKALLAQEKAEQKAQQLAQERAEKADRQAKLQAERAAQAERHAAERAEQLAQAAARRAEVQAAREERQRVLARHRAEREAALAQAQEERRAQLALQGNNLLAGRVVQQVQAPVQEYGSDEGQSASMQAYTSNAAASGVPLNAVPTASVNNTNNAYAPGYLELNSRVAYVMDADTGAVLHAKNEGAMLPIASITKLMTALVTLDNNLPLDGAVTVTDEDYVECTRKSSRHKKSSLVPGTTLSRGQMLLLALMKSENCAAQSLASSFPGGTYNFVRYMNQKAQELGMRSTQYVDPTGLSAYNQSTARDLAVLVAYASRNTTLRTYSTATDYAVDTGYRIVQYGNTNALTSRPGWVIELQKTGTLNEAGSCVAMQTVIAGRRLVVILLDASNAGTRTRDAERIRYWVESDFGRATTAVAYGQAGSTGAAQGNLMRALTSGY